MILYNPQKKGEIITLVPTFWGYGQLRPYIFVAVNLIFVIYNLKSIWSLPLTH